MFLQRSSQIQWSKWHQPQMSTFYFHGNRSLREYLINGNAYFACNQRMVWKLIQHDQVETAPYRSHSTQLRNKAGYNDKLHVFIRLSTTLWKRPFCMLMFNITQDEFRSCETIITIWICLIYIYIFQMKMGEDQAENFML